MIGIATAASLEAIATKISQSTLGGVPIEFAIRYIDPAKHLTVEEIAVLSDGGLDIVSVWEAGRPTARSYFSREAGVRDARGAYTAALNLDQPITCPIFFAVDYDAYSDADRLAVSAWFDGLAEGAGGAVGSIAQYPIGIYGGATVLKWAQEYGMLWYWQAAAPGWNGNRADWPGAHLRTRGTDVLLGVTVNRVESFQPDFGGWYSP